MITRKKRSRILSIALSAMLFLTISVPFTTESVSAYTPFYDIRGHWAEGYIKDIVEKGIINGYPNGSFKPDAPVTRAEFISMINKTLGNGDMNSIYFSDVPYNAWYYNDVSKAVAANYISGYNDNSFKPNSFISREEAAVIISRIVPTYNVKGTLKKYKDAKEVSSWAKDALDRVCGKGYIGPYDDEKIHPSDFMTRAQTAKAICSIASGEIIETGTKRVKAASTKLEGTIYSNGVTISDTLGDESATINNCVILGKLTINGGGTNTITVSNSKVSRCEIEKENSAVRLLLSGESSIGETSVEETAIVEAGKLSGGFFGSGFAKVNIRALSDVTLKGNFSEVNMTGRNSALRFDTGKIGALNISRDGENSEISTDTKATITSATVNASAAFYGKGTITNMVVYTDDSVTYETKPTNWTLGSDGRAPTYTTDGLTVAFLPKIGSTGVNLNTKITITFSSAVFNSDGKALGASDILESIELHRRSASGPKLEYTAALNSSKKVITITPKDRLTEDTKYYIKILDDSIKNSNGAFLDAEYSYFTTGDETGGLSGSFTPENGDTDISLLANPTIIFPEAVKTSTGKPVTEEYIEANIEFREGSASGAKVAFDGTISGGRTKITLDPSEKLKENTKYYVGVPDGKFKTEVSGIAIPGSNVIWTTRGSSSNPVTTPTVSITTASTDTTITATVTPNLAGTLYAVLVSGSAIAPSADQIAAGKDGSNNTAISSKNAAAAANTASTLTFTGLMPNTSYMVYTILKTSSATSSVVSKSAATAASTLQPAALSGLTVAGMSSFTPTFSASTTSYTVTMPLGATSAAINATAASGTTIQFKEGSGSYSSAPGNSFDVTLASGSTTTVFVKVSASGKSDTEYTLSIR